MLIEPLGIVGSVLRIYGVRARTLLPLALVGVAVRQAASGRPDSLAGLAGSLLALVLVALFSGVAIQLAADVERSSGGSSARIVARRAVAAVLPSVAVTLIIAVVAGIAGILLLGVLAAALISGSGSLTTAEVAIGIVLIVITPLLLTRWAVVVPVAVLERTGVGVAFRRNRALVRGHGRRILAALLLLYIPLGALSLLAMLLTHGRDGVAQAVLTVVTLPVYSLAAPVLYLALLDAAPPAGTLELAVIHAAPWARPCTQPQFSTFSSPHLIASQSQTGRIRPEHQCKRSLSLPHSTLFVRSTERTRRKQQCQQAP